MRAKPWPTCLRAAVRALVSAPFSGTSKITLPAAAFCANACRVGIVPRCQCVPDGQGNAVLEPDVGSDRVDQMVDPRLTVGIGTLQPGQSQHGTFDGDRGVDVASVTIGLTGPARQRARLARWRPGPAQAWSYADSTVVSCHHCHRNQRSSVKTVRPWTMVCKQVGTGRSSRLKRARGQCQRAFWRSRSVGPHGQRGRLSRSDHAAHV